MQALSLPVAYTAQQQQQQPRPSYSDNNGAVVMGNHVGGGGGGGSSNNNGGTGLASSPQDRHVGAGGLVFRGASGMPPEAMAAAVIDLPGGSRVSSPRNPILGNVPRVNSGEGTTVPICE